MIGRGTERHYGKFAIKLEVLNRFADVLMADLFAHMIVVRAEYHVDMDAILYAAYSKKFFRLTKEGEASPTYTITIKDGEITAQELKYE